VVEATRYFVDAGRKRSVRRQGSLFGYRSEPTHILEHVNGTGRTFFSHLQSNRVSFRTCTDHVRVERKGTGVWVERRPIRQTDKQLRIEPPAHHIEPGRTDDIAVRDCQLLSREDYKLGFGLPMSSAQFNELITMTLRNFSFRYEFDAANQRGDLSRGLTDIGKLDREPDHHSPIIEADRAFRLHVQGNPRSLGEAEVLCGLSARRSHFGELLFHQITLPLDLAKRPNGGKDASETDDHKSNGGLGGELCKVKSPSFDLPNPIFFLGSLFLLGFSLLMAFCVNYERKLLCAALIGIAGLIAISFPVWLFYGTFYPLRPALPQNWLGHSKECQSAEQYKGTHIKEPVA
jgi:hypothetical protein